MAKTSTPPADLSLLPDADAPPHAPAPDLSDVMLTGAIFKGEPLTGIVLKWEGGELATKLRPPVATDDSGSGRDRILDKLRSSEVALSRKQLAKLLSLKSAKGRFATEVSRMVETGEILERDQLYTDDANKFPDVTSDL